LIVKKNLKQLISLTTTDYKEH